jgi:hypothetical protein
MASWPVLGSWHSAHTPYPFGDRLFPEPSKSSYSLLSHRPSYPQLLTKSPPCFSAGLARDIRFGRSVTLVVLLIDLDIEGQVENHPRDIGKKVLALYRRGVQHVADE